MAKTDYMVLWNDGSYRIYNTYKQIWIDGNFKTNESAWKFIYDNNL